MPTYYQHYSSLITSNMNANVNYLLKIYRTIPNPLGYVPDLLLAGTPVIQEWQEDDPFAPIRGCTLKINIIANHNLPTPYINVSLIDFYSENDNEFYVELIDNQNGELVFAGYIMQDDCSELQADFAHEIQLTATDNLATLSEIRFDEAVINNAIPITLTGQFDSFITSGVNYITFDSSTNVDIVPGQTITISGTATALDGVWTIISDLFSPSPINLNTFVVVETVPVVTNANGTLDYNKRTQLRGYLTVREIFRNCIKSTNLNLVKTNVLANLYPTTGTNGNWFDDTYLNVLTFKNDSTWDSCYDILEKLMSRFCATLFQAHGQWWVVRWGELWRWADGNGMAFYGCEYGSDMQGPGSATGWTNYNAPFQQGEIEAGLLRSIIRPYKYVQETMQYNQVANIITNGDLSILGPLIRTYTATIDGVLCDINEYEVPYWYLVPSMFTSIEYFIRVAIAQNTGQEVQRYLVINTSDAVTPAIISNDIDVEIGDVIEFSFDAKTNISQTGYNTFVYYLFISDTAGLTYNGLQPNTSGYWVPTIGLIMQYANVNTNEWATFSVKTLPSPRRGRMIIGLPGICFGGGETHIQNIRINITNGVNTLQRIIGHRHQDSLDLVIKNIDEKEIAIDDTRSNLIAGTTFLETYTDLIRDRVQTWNFDTGTQILETQLGRITTQEIEFWRRKPRAKFNGSLLKTYSFMVGRAISPVFCILLNTGGLGAYRYVFGSLTLDYKQNSADFTLYEICQLDENISEFNDDTYTFNYLYENN